MADNRRTFIRLCFHMRAPFIHVLMILSLALGGCALIDDGTVRPKSGAVNTGWNEARNNSILLNIVRSGDEEPINFVAFSKYTGTGSHTAGLSMSATSPPTAGATGTYGPFTLGGNSGNSIELADLDTSEFYSAMSTPISKEELDTLIQANGVDRELLFYLAIEKFKVTLLSGEQYNVVNDPRDDGWTDPVTGAREQISSHCDDLSRNEDIYNPVANPNGLSPPFGSPIWTGERQSNDCKFQKFRLFVHLALRNGLRLEPLELQNPASRQGVKDAPKLTMQSQFCYDPALAREFNVSGREDDPSKCGGKRPTELGHFRFRGAQGQIISISAVEPVVRSPIGVFRYLGRLIDPAVANRVRLLTRTPNIYGQPLLQVESADQDCFAEAWNRGSHYCVPSAGALPTKAAFAVLATLIALHTKRSDLPPPSTLLIAP